MVLPASGDSTGSRSSRGPVPGRDDPHVEVERPDARTLTGRQLAIVQLGAVVASVRVTDDGAVVADEGEQAPRPRIDAERLGPAELDAATDRRAGRQLE